MEKDEVRTSGLVGLALDALMEAAGYHTDGDDRTLKPVRPKFAGKKK